MYAEHNSGEKELYDLRNDPFELVSRHNAPRLRVREGTACQPPASPEELRRRQLPVSLVPAVGRRHLALAACAIAVAAFLAAGARAQAAPPAGQVNFRAPSLFPKLQAQRPRLRGPLQGRAGHCEGPRFRRLGGGDRQPSLPQRRLQRWWCRWARGAPSPSPCARRAVEPVPLSRSLPAERLPQLHLQPLGPGVAEVLRGGPGVLSPPGQALRDRLRQLRGAGLVVPRPGEEPQGARGRERCCGSISRPTAWEVHRLDGSLVRTLDAVGPAADVHDLQLLNNGGLPGRRLRQPKPRRHERLRRLERCHRHQRGAPAGQQRRPTAMGLEEQGPRLAGRHRASLAVGATRQRLRHRPLELDRARRGLGDRLLPALRRRVQDPQVDRRRSSGSWAGRGQLQEPRGAGRPPRLHLRRPTRRAPARRRDGDSFRQPHGLGAQGAAGGALHGSTVRRGRRPCCESITDPAVTASSCCGSARRLGNGHWLISWGLPNGVAGYRPSGQRSFLLDFNSTFSSRATPVPGAVSARDLREAMDAIQAASG